MKRIFVDVKDEESNKKNMNEVFSKLNFNFFYSEIFFNFLKSFKM